MTQTLSTILFRLVARTPFIVLACYAALLTWIASNYIATAIWVADDAFFFVRYAENFLNGGRFSWNPDGAPVYGNTSQIYQFAVALVYWLTGRNPILTLNILSYSGAWAAMAATLWAFFRASPAAVESRWIVPSIGAVLAVLLGVDRPLISQAFFGMETTWSAALIALLFVALHGLYGQPESWARRLVVAGLMGLVFAMRPDATIVPVVMLGALMFWGGGKVKRGALMALGGGLSLIAAFSIACWLYYGTALPLALHIKVMGFSDIDVDKLSFYVENMRRLGSILIGNQIVMALALASLLDWRSLSPILRGTAIALILFWAYHLLLTYSITADVGRYYFPALPLAFVLAGLLCTRIFQALIGIADRARRDRWLRIAMALVGAAVAMQCAQFFVRILPTLRDAWRAPPSVSEEAVRLNASAYLFYDNKAPKIMAAVPPGCVLAGSEDGVISVLYKGPILDLSGLHNSDIALREFSADRLLLQDRPEILMMPQRAYEKWNMAIRTHPAFIRDYENHPIGAEVPIEVAFRKDSACAQAMQRTLYGVSR